MVGVAVLTGVTVPAFDPPPLPEPPVALVDVVVVWSDSSVAFALARVALAAESALCRGKGSIVDKACPVVMGSPTETSTLVTVPPTAKLSLT
jgi:hypothetical protein